MNMQTFSAAISGSGGLAIFLFGMIMLTEGLNDASGHRFRTWMSSLSGSRMRGWLLGLAMGTAVLSGASTVMAVGLINAGLLSLAGAIPLIAGANLGTTVSMQLIAFDIGWLWAAFAIVGLCLRLLFPASNHGKIGRALFGLAMLFLGMRLMSDAVHPFRDVLSNWIMHHNGSDWPAFLTSFIVSAFFTALIQSSGATIGILFALSTAGVLTNVSQAFPLVMGAHIGTCITAVLSSAGTSTDARRGAVAHLLFNVITVFFSVMLMRVIIRIVDQPAVSLARQVACVHTISMLMGCVLVIPLLRPFLALLRYMTPFSNNAQEHTFLFANLLEDPKSALDACRNELGRITRIARRGFVLNRALLHKPDNRTYNLVKQTEASVDQIYRSARRFLMQLSARISSREQAAQIQWYNLCLIYIERISDHNDNLCDLTRDMQKRVAAKDIDYVRRICDGLYEFIEPILEGVEQAWLATDKASREHALLIRNQRAVYLPESEQRQSDMVAAISSGKIDALSGFILTEYISEMDRIVRHTKKIAGVLEKSDALPSDTGGDS